MSGEDREHITVDFKGLRQRLEELEQDPSKEGNRELAAALRVELHNVWTKAGDSKAVYQVLDSWMGRLDIAYPKEK